MPEDLSNPINDSDSAKTPIASESARSASKRLSVGMPPVKQDYRPRHQLGSGSFGEVWLVEEWVNGKCLRLLAVKFLHPGHAGALTELFDEVEKLVPLIRERGIVHIHHFDIENERPYFSMDYAAEGSLAKLIASQDDKRLPVSHALTIFRRIVEAIAAVHRKGIIHCDLKPENVLLDEDFQPMVADFGQARLKGKGPPNTGSWYYMAPEQMEAYGRNAETSCDVYALGAIFYKMVTGNEPRANAATHESISAQMSVREKLDRHRKSILAAPKPVDHHSLVGIDVPLRSIIDRCLETEQGYRFVDGNALIAALDKRDRIFEKRKKIGLGLISTTLVMILLIILLVTYLPSLFHDSARYVIDAARDRDAIAATLAGDIVDDGLQDKLVLVRKWADDPVLREAFGKAIERPGGNASLKAKIVELLIENRTFGLNVTDIKIMSASAYSHVGLELAVVTNQNESRPEAVDVREEYDGLLWNWRGWFNEVGSDQVPRETPYEPIKEPSISAPYWKVKPGKPEVPEHAIAFSAPIVPPDGNTEARGVLVITVLINPLFRWSEDPIINAHGLIAIVDKQMNVVLHKYLNPVLPSYLPDRFPFLDMEGKIERRLVKTANLRVNRNTPFEAYRELLAPKANARGVGAITRLKNTISRDNYNPEFADPIEGPHGKQTYLASFFQLPTSRWWVIVQNSDALKNFYAFQRKSYWFCGSSYLICLAVVIGFWSITILRLRREERFTDG